jgi:hypothetical protein
MAWMSGGFMDLISGDRLALVLRKRNPEAPIRLVFPPVSLLSCICSNITDAIVAVQVALCTGKLSLPPPTPANPRRLS